jgi:bifunctional DNA-binding transcriptional regulator/antitoxin component of YhaV-PrlF toxin-antitoxin module
MVKVQFSKQNELILPEPLGRALGLSEGDRVEVRRQDNVLCFRRWEPDQLPGPLTDLAQIISSSRLPGSVDVDALLDKHGYEQVNERSDPRL